MRGSCRGVDVPSYLGHLNHVGELGQAGDRDDVVVGFELGPENRIECYSIYDSRVFFGTPLTIRLDFKPRPTHRPCYPQRAT